MRPKPKQRFNAFCIRPAGRLAIGCPVRCDRVDTYAVHGVDTDGEDRVFKTHDFRFEAVKKGKT